MITLAVIEGMVSVAQKRREGGEPGVIRRSRRCVVLLAAVVVDLLLGDKPNRVHPVSRFGWLATFCERWVPSGKLTRLAGGRLNAVALLGLRLEEAGG